MTTKRKTLITKTPVCRFQYTWVVEPDTKYEAMWKVTCLIPMNDGLELEQKLEAFLGEVNLRCQGYSGNFGVGIKIQPQAVKIHKHVEYVKTAQEFGFDATSKAVIPLEADFDSDEF